MVEMVRPSERPARALLAVPITLPISLMEVAPTSAMISFILASTSASESCLGKRIGHGGHPVLRWMMDNIYIRSDPAGNIKPDKEKSTEKIDGAVATVMALDRAIRCGNDASESVYDSRGLLFI